MKICSSASISYHCFLNSIMYVPEYSCWVEVRLEPKPSCMCGRTSLEQENCIFSGVVSHLNACRYHKVTIWPLWMSLCFHSLSTTTYKFSLWEQINNQSFAVPKQKVRETIRWITENPSNDTRTDTIRDGFSFPIEKTQSKKYSWCVEAGSGT